MKMCICVCLHKYTALSVYNFVFILFFLGCSNTPGRKKLKSIRIKVPRQIAVFNVLHLDF